MEKLILPDRMKKETIGLATLYLGDCRGYLDDIHADAIVTDPPYGIGEAAGKNKSRGYLAEAKDYGDDSWDDEIISYELMQKIIFSAKYSIVKAENRKLTIAPRGTKESAECARNINQ